MSLRAQRGNLSVSPQISPISADFEPGTVNREPKTGLNPQSDLSDESEISNPQSERPPALNHQSKIINNQSKGIPTAGSCRLQTYVDLARRSAGTPVDSPPQWSHY